MERWEEVGTREDFRDGTRRIVVLEDAEVCVLEVDGEFHAFENRCLHQGGPVGEGTLIGKVETELGPGGEVLGERFSTTELHIACPWHGWEYDVRTGRCAGDRRFALRRYEVDVRGEKVYVRV